MPDQSNTTNPQPTYDIVFRGHSNAITRVEFSQDGKTLVSTGYDWQTRVWDVETGELRNILPFSYNYLFPDGKRIVAGNAIYDIATGALLRKFRRRIEAVSPDGRLLIAHYNQWSEEAFTDTSILVRLFDSKTGRTKHALARTQSELSPIESIDSFAFSPDGGTLAFVGKEKIVESTDNHGTIYFNSAHHLYLYDLKTKSLTTKAMPSPVEDLYWCTRGVHLLTLSNNDIALFGGVETSEKIQVFRSESSPWEQKECSLSPNGRLLALGITTGEVEVYDVTTGKMLWKKSLHRGWVRTLAFSPDSLKLATAGDDHAILFHDAETGEQLLTSAGSPLISSAIPNVDTLAFTAEGDAISTFYEDGSARLWNIGSRKLEKQAQSLPPPLENFYRKQPDIAKYFWRIPFDELPRYEPPLYSVPAVTVSQDGSLVALYRNCAATIVGNDILVNWVGSPGAFANYEQPLKTALHSIEPSAWVIWDVGQKKIRTQIPVHAWGNAGVFLDSTRFACTNGEKGITVYSIETGNILQKLEGENLENSTLISSPNGDVIAIIDWNSLALWDLNTNELNRLDWVVDDGLYLAFFLDGERAITGLPHMDTAYIRSFSHEQGIRLEGHGARIAGVDCSPDGTLVATGGKDGMVKVWDAASGKLKVTFLALPNEQWVSYTPEGEITGTPGAEEYLLRVPL